MSTEHPNLLKKYIKQLEEHAKPSKNDSRHLSYVKYINAFVSCFCKEKVYIVGSTGEQLKLRRSKNDGDTDFLICSGRLEIPVENIEERPDLRCYVKIRGDNLKAEICGDLINGYISADMLRELRPELFTFMRAVFSEVTTNLTIMRGEHVRVTKIGLPMKVGLGGIELHNLEIDSDILLTQTSNKRLEFDRDVKVEAKLKERWRNLHKHSEDMKIVQRILKVIQLAKVPRSNGEYFGNINKFAHDIDSVMQRIPLDQEQARESNDADAEVKSHVNESPPSRRIKATYSSMSTRDYVPALKVVGDRKLNCLIEWKKRVEKSNFPPRNVVEEIFDMDVYLVARDTPMISEHRIYFCYSFNLAELKLAKCLSTTQRSVFLILKSYLSGRLTKLHQGLNINEMKLKTYFLKTAFFWVCEREDPSLWTEENIITAVKKVLHFIMQCLREKELSHYFVNSNLFVELEKSECDALLECIQQILREPIDSIGDFEFIKENESRRREIWFNTEEVQCLSELKEDGGRARHLDNLEDALIDILRGFSECSRDVGGKAPIKEAVDKVFDIFIEEERQTQIYEGISDMSAGGADIGNLTQEMASVNMSQTAIIASLLNSFITGGGTQSINSRKSDQRMQLLCSICSMFRGGQRIIDSLGGQDGVRNVIQQTADQSVDPVLELKRVAGKYLSYSDDEEGLLAQEVFQKASAYFLTRKE